MTSDIEEYHRQGLSDERLALLRGETLDDGKSAREREIETTMRTDISRYRREKLDEEYLEILRRKEAKKANRANG